MRPLRLKPRKKRSGEIAFEGELVKALSVLNVMFVKVKPTQAGFPDRLALTYPNRMRLVELKGWNGELSPVQIQVHKELALIGVPVLVLKKKPIDEAAREILRFLYSE